MAGLRPAGRRRHALLPMRGGGCGGASGHPRNAAAPLGMGEVRRTPPHADSPHSSRLTRWGGTGTAASKPLPFQRAPPTQTSLARAGGSSMSRGRGESPATAGDSKLSRPRSNAPGWAEGRILSMLLNLGGGILEGAPLALSFTHLPPAAPIPQARSKGFHSPAGASRHPHLRVVAQAVVREVMNHPSPRGCRQHLSQAHLPPTPTPRESGSKGWGALVLWVLTSPFLPRPSLYPWYMLQVLYKG